VQPFLKEYPPSIRIPQDMPLKRLRELSMMVTFKKSIIRRFKRLIKLSEILSTSLKRRKLKEIRRRKE
jgi:hypothetical protein